MVMSCHVVQCHARMHAFMHVTYGMSCVAFFVCGIARYQFFVWCDVMNGVVLRVCM